MNPVAIQIGSFAIRWYGIMAALGLLAAGSVLNWNRKYANLTSDQCQNSLIVAIVSGIIGARIFYVVQFFHLYRNNLLEIVRIDRGGLVFYGGFILAVISLWVYSKRAKIDFVRLLDAFTPTLAVGHAFGRIGCFLNGCCYGRPTQCFFGIAYPAGMEPALRYGCIPLIPIQLFEAAENLLCACLYVVLLRKCKRGVAWSCYFMIYGILRFINEYGRGDNPRLWGLFTPAQLIGIGVVAAGLTALIYFSRKNESENA